MLTELLGRFRKRRSTEENSGIPVEVVAGKHTRPPSIEEMVRMYIRQDMSAQAQDDGEESFGEADDFEEEDPDIIPLTHHNVAAMTEDELHHHAAGYGIEIRDPGQGSPGSPGVPEATAAGTSDSVKT